jgi:preprotein translocase subunit SecF
LRTCARRSLPPTPTVQKATIDDGNRRYQIYTNDQANVAADYAPLVIAYRNGAAVQLSDVADVQNSVQDVRNLGMSNGQPSVLVILFRQPNANIIETIDNVKAELPHLEAAMPADMNVTVAMDRSITIRASLHDTELTLVLAVILVTIVVYFFLRNFRATLITSIAVPISIFGTFGAMYLLGYSLDILSLMALTIATGFVVDDAIVVMENISRHLEDGMPRMEAAFRGAREVGFTVLSISLSLIAVFIPILLMGGIFGRLFHEFTVTLSIAILVSLAISLTTTPMMCALFLQTRPAQQAERRPDLIERAAARLRAYAHLGAAPQQSGVSDFCWYDLPERGPVHRRTQGLLSAARHRTFVRLASSRSKHLLPSDERKAAAGNDHRATGSRGRERGGLHWTGQRLGRIEQHRLGLRFAETAVSTHFGGSGDRATAAEAHPDPQRTAVPGCRSGSPRRRQTEQRSIPVHAAVRERGGSLRVDAQARRRARA